MPSEPSPTPWAAVAGLTLACCFSAWMISGDPILGAGAALVAFCLTAVVGLGRKGGPAGYYAVGFGLAASALIVTTCGTRRTGPDVWHDLQREYATRVPAPRGSERRREVRLLRLSHGGFMAQPFRFRRVFVSFDADGIYLKLSWPQTLAYSALRVPLSRLTGCATGGSTFPGTRVRIQHPSAELVVGDRDGRVLAWCRAHDLAEE